ncbi:MAG: diguanylate cyclase [Pseudomonadota bacterium]
MAQEEVSPKLVVRTPPATVSEFTESHNGLKRWRRFAASASVRAVLDSPVLANIALLALWVLVWQLGRLVEYTEHASVWFPVAGLSFAILLLEGARLLPGLLGGCVLMTIWVGRNYGVALTDLELAWAGTLFAAAHLGSYALGARCLREIALRGKRDLPLLVVGFLLIAAASSLLATASGMAALVVAGMMPMGDVGAAWLPYWIGDMAGVIVLAPFFGAALVSLNPAKTASLRASFNLNQQRATAQFKYKLLLILTLLAASMWLAHATRSQNSAFAVFFLVIPYMWIASTESAFCNIISVAVGSIAIALLVHAFGLKEFSMVYQFAINVIAANSLFALALPTLLADNLALRRIADTDSLTRAASRSHLEQRIRLDIVRCRMHREALTVILFDIDHFKRINDGRGHAIGDRALQHACTIAQQALRPTDILGRLGGDEFVALLPGIDHAAARAIAERIRVQLANSSLEGGPALTASFGIAEMGPGDICETLLERADKALYRAKQDGRNRVA